MAARPRSRRVEVYVGTRKGAFRLSSGFDRRRWSLEGPFLKGAEVNDILLDQRGTPTLYAAATSYWFGTTIQRSIDGGETWTASEGGVLFAEGSGKHVDRIWTVAAPPWEGPGVIYAGVDPAGLFRSDDGGMTWSEVSGLNQHATRSKWNPGAGGLMVHGIRFHPKKRGMMYVAISAAGVFATEDGGTSWDPCNQGVAADFLPDPSPSVGQCVHSLEIHPRKPALLYQQNHCGVYRSDNGGRTWTDISDGLPSPFGFVIAVDPRDPKKVFVIPEEGPEFRSAVNGEFAVWVTENAGRSWTPLRKGLPARPAYLHVLRQAFRTDGLDPLGLYLGTSSGAVYASANGGKSWKQIAEHLPEITALHCAVTAV
jgi:photosystem II stability/assembly factor-like uncharacterized protein